MFKTIIYLYSGATTRTLHNTSLLRACGVLAREQARFPPQGLARGAKQQLEQPAAAACTPCDFFPGRLAPPRAEIRTRTNIARRRPALWEPGKHLGWHEFRPSHVRCGVRAPAAAPRAVAPCAAGRGPGVGCRKIDRPVSGTGRGRENHAAPHSAATVSRPDRWTGAGGRCSPYGSACTSGRYGSGARWLMGASAKVIFGTGPLGFD